MEESLGEKMLVKWHTLKFVGDQKSQLMIRINSFDDEFNVSSTFAAYVYPPLIVIYFMFTIFMVILLRKNDLMSFVHFIILVNTFIQIIPSLVISPLKLVFYHVANEDAPMPYPWCLVFVSFENFVQHTVFSISLYLKVLLSINRLCSVYFPFKMQFWFSSSRKRYMCITIILFCLIFQSLVDFIDFPFDEAVGFDDLWGNGEIRPYRTCTMERFSVKSETPWKSNQLYFSIIRLTLLFIGSFLFLCFNILFLVKIKRIASERKSTMNLNQTNKRNNTRLARMNKIYMWVALATVVIEIPQLITIFLTSSAYFSLFGASRSFVVESGLTLTQQIAKMVVLILVPFDLIIFAILSGKIKNAIKSMICRKPPS